MIRGGENIYPREVEEFLYSHPSVADVQVAGVPDLRYGEELCAWIKLRDGSEVSTEEIREYCRGATASYKIPRYVRFTDGFPVIVTGRVQKFKLGELSIAELGLADAAKVQSRDRLAGGRDTHDEAFVHGGSNRCEGSVARSHHQYGIRGEPVA